MSIAVALAPISLYWVAVRRAHDSRAVLQCARRTCSSVERALPVAADGRAVPATTGDGTVLTYRERALCGDRNA